MSITTIFQSDLCLGHLPWPQLTIADLVVAIVRTATGTN